MVKTYNASQNMVKTYNASQNMVKTDINASQKHG